MKKITHIIVYCSDSDWGNVNVIHQWHLNRGWSDTGYHFVIQNDIPVENILGHYETASGKRQGKTCPNFDMGQTRQYLNRLHE